MAYVITDPVVGYPKVGSVYTSARGLALGLEVQAVSPTYGGGRFTWLKGVTSTAVGSWVTYNYDDGTTALLSANAIGPVAVAMAAVDANTKYGWYQIIGKAVGKALSGYVDNALVFATGTPGSVDDAVVDGDMVHLAKGASAVDTPTSGLAEFEISRPYCDDILSND